MASTAPPEKIPNREYLKVKRDNQLYSLRRQQGMSLAEKIARRSEPSMTSKDKNPKGGLSAHGRRKLRRAGQNVKPGVRGEANTPEKMRRKGQFLRRHYGRKDPHPLKKPSGKPTRYALQANAWGEPVPTSVSAVRRLAAKGQSLLDRYSRTKKASAFMSEGMVLAFLDELQRLE